MRQGLKHLSVIVLASLLVVSNVVRADTLEERPSGAAMVIDAFAIRPITFIATGLGATVFLVSLPFSVLGGNVHEAADKLVVTPFQATFLRCLGCTTQQTTAP